LAKLPSFSKFCDQQGILTRLQGSAMSAGIDGLFIFKDALPRFGYEVSG
jgi:hypothetical protein